MTTTAPSPTQLIRSAIRFGRLPKAALLLDGDLPATVQDATAEAESAQTRIDELASRIGDRPDTFTQWPLMSRLNRATTIRDRALFLASALGTAGSEVAA